MSRFSLLRRVVFLGWIGTALTLASACQKPAPDVREWTPKDHTNNANKGAEPTGQVNATPGATEAPPKGLDPVTLTTWGTQCAACHGKIGKGDGPTGRMVKATDLSNPTWQAQVTDEQIRQSITRGKNAMPAFATLPPETIDNLLWLVRWFNSDQTVVQARMAALKAPPAAATTTQAAPSTSSPAPTASPETKTTPER